MWAKAPMKHALRAAQVALALLFAWTGITKLSVSIDWLAANGRLYAEHLPAFVVRLAGVLELLGALGLALPMVSGRGARLVPLAALGLAGVMLGAVVVHFAIGEAEAAPLPAALCALCVVLAWGRRPGRSARREGADDV